MPLKPPCQALYRRFQNEKKKKGLWQQMTFMFEGKTFWDNCTHLQTFLASKLCVFIDKSPNTHFKNHAKQYSTNSETFHHKPGYHSLYYNVSNICRSSTLKYTFSPPSPLMIMLGFLLLSLSFGTFHYCISCFSSVSLSLSLYNSCTLIYVVDQVLSSVVVIFSRGGKFFGYGTGRGGFLKLQISDPSSYNADSNLNVLQTDSNTRCIHMAFPFCVGR
jgi:hypothetical protein